VYRLWFTGFDPDTANLKIYIDGASFARTYLLAKLFTGAYSELPSPLAGEESGGFYCYVPIPFRSSIRITTNGAAAKPLQLFYYNVGYHRYTRGRNIVSWPESNAAVAAAVGVWNKAELGENPNSGDPTTVRISGSVRLPGMGIPISLQEIEGPRIVYGIRINVDADVSVLNDILLRITWDREPDAAVHAPLSAFFALGHYGANSARSLVVGAIDDWLYTYFPMPFAHHANIELINRLPMPLESVKYEILHKAFNEDFSRVGYFRTAYFRHLAGPGLSMTLLDIEGAGHLVGVAMSFEGSGPHDMEANAPSLLFLEGDERIYVDDCRTPTIYGTGTEDFFNAGWYFTKVPFSKPVHGCTTKNTDKGYGVVSAYRLFLHDAVPFRKHLRATIEHGPANDVPVLARTVAYYYYQPVIRALPWGRLEIGDPGSESQYGYWNSSQHWSGSRTYTFEGDLDKIQISHGGRAHRGTSRFAFPTPADNQGFLLRRMFDQGIRNQRARVRVNGQDLGSWSRTGGNTADNDAGRGKWCEDDLPIPASFTSGKTYLHFDVAYEPSDATLSDPALDWNEFSYSLYDLHETGPAHPSLMSPRLPILCAIDVVSRNLDKLDLVCPDEGGTLVPVAWEPIFGASWYVWRPIAGVSVLPGCPVSLVSRSTDKIDAFFTNSGSQVCTAAWDPKLGWHTWRMTDSMRPGSGELTPAVTLGAAITAVSRSTDHLDVFVVATDGRLMSAAWPDDDPRYAGSGAQ